MRGHVIVHPQFPDIVSELLPSSIDDIIAPICVVYTSSNAPTAEWLRKKAQPLLVCADKVQHALLWLKANNYLYHNISINNQVLDEIAQLPALPYHVEPEPHDEALMTGYVDEQQFDKHWREQRIYDVPFEQ